MRVRGGGREGAGSDGSEARQVNIMSVWSASEVRGVHNWRTLFER